MRQRLILLSGQILLWSGQALLFGLPPQTGLAAPELPVATTQKDKFDGNGSGQALLFGLPPQTGLAAPKLPVATTPVERAPTPQRSPGQLLRSLLTTSPVNRISGTAKSLADILQQDGLRQVGPTPLSRDDQTARIQAYWDLSAAIAQDALVQLERIELQALHAGIQTPGAHWQQAFANTQARIDLARRAALIAQYKLQQLTTSQAQVTIPHESLPIPADHPHCAVYDTRYDQIFQNRPSEFAWQLHELLGNQYQQLLRLAVAVDSATTQWQQVSRQRQVQSDGSELLRAHENLRLQRRQFVVAVHTYNQTIADYTHLASPDSIKAQHLVTMLIYIEQSRPADQGKQPEIERTSGDLNLSSQSTNRQTQSTNGQAQSTNGQTQSTNGQAQSTNRQTQSTNGQAQSTNRQTQSTNRQAQPSNPREHSILVPAGAFTE